MRNAQYLAMFATAWVSAVGAFAADWPNWRGPNHDGISPEKGFRTTWTEPPKILWRAPIGSGFSSFASVGDRVFTAGTKDGQQALFCLDAVTGREIWSLPFEKQRKDGQGGDGPRATPTVHDGRVYMQGGHGLLLCVSAQDGKEIWRKQFSDEPQWGYAGSVLIEGDMAVACGGGKDGSLVAFDRKTGDVIWKCAEDKVGYATPYPFTFNGKRYIVGFLARQAIVAEAKTGREVWREPWETEWKVNAPTPIFHDGYLFLSSGYSTGCALYKLSARGDGLTGEKVWGISKVLMSRFQTCVLRDGVLYGSDQSRAFKCVEFLTGKELWHEDGYANATVLLADGHLVVLKDRGKLVIAPVSSKGFKPTGEAEILAGGPKRNQCWTIPTLCNGKLFARNLKEAVCVDLSGR